VRHLASFGCLLGAVVGAAGCRASASTPAHEPTSTPPGSTLRITFAGTPGARLTAADVRVAGDIPVTVTLASSHGGTIKTHDVDAEGVGSRAARFPRLDPTREAGASAVLVSSRGSDDELDPGDRAFSYGATVRLDKRSESDAAGSADNGNNVLQKGLFLDPTQYKLQVDHGFASCRVAGSAGTLTVRSRVAIQPAVWYRLACARTQDSLTIAVHELTTKGSEIVDHQVARGVTGRISPEEGSTYLSLGAKVIASGAIPASSTDQFNGLVGSVFVNILGHE
jgi:hypothetical protein